MPKMIQNRERVTDGDFCAWGECGFLIIATKKNPYWGIKHKKLDENLDFEWRIGLCDRYQKVLETPQEYEATCRRCLECLEETEGLKKSAPSDGVSKNTKYKKKSDRAYWDEQRGWIEPTDPEWTEERYQKRLEFERSVSESLKKIGFQDPKPAGRLEHKAKK